MHLLMREEIFNTASHAFGIALSVAALILLVLKAVNYGTAWQIVTFVVYGCTLVTLYSASTMYHGTKNLRKKSLYNRFDHAAIYLLIAGTYTPYALITMKGPWGWSIFAIQWSMAIAGVVFKLFFYKKKYRKISAYLYLVMGWAGVIGTHIIIQNLPTMGLIWLLLGAFSYSIGVVFYLRERLPFSHGVFHVFILGGSTFHFLSILLYVL